MTVKCYALKLKPIVKGHIHIFIQLFSGNLIIILLFIFKIACVVHFPYGDARIFMYCYDKLNYFLLSRICAAAYIYIYILDSSGSSLHFKPVIYAINDLTIIEKLINFLLDHFHQLIVHNSIGYCMFRDCRKRGFETYIAVHGTTSNNNWEKKEKMYFEGFHCDPKWERGMVLYIVKIYNLCKSH